MKITSEWVGELALKHGKRAKDVRDALWPEQKTKSIKYIDGVKSMGIEMVIKIADAIGCSLDDLCRRPYPYLPLVNGSNNKFGNVKITNDPKTLVSIINAQNNIIDHLNAEVKRLNQSCKEQLKAKDKQIDRLIKLAQGNDKQ